MNLFAKDQALLWIWAWIFCSCSHIGIYGQTTSLKHADEKTGKKNSSHKSSKGNGKLGLTKATPSPIQQFSSHSGKVCSTWGNYHFKTFDGDLYYFPGTCNYLFASHCKSNNEDFNIQIRRIVENGIPVISHITAILYGVVLEIRGNTTMLDGVMVTEIPAEKSKVHIGKLGRNIKIRVSNDISLIWNRKDSLLLKLNRKKYAKQTCGLCGDFSGVRGFTLDGEQLTPVQYGNLQKMSGPTEECLDVPSLPPNYCKDKDEICKNILTSAAFSNCNTILEPTDYIDMCVQDLCQCGSEDKMLCLCGVLAEYSRQCTHAGGVPGNWRTPKMCPQSCPLNMVYQESGSPCPNTCSNTERTEVCEDHSTDGCFCSPGTVLDDINNKGCILQKDCYCVYNSETYSPGSSFSNPCRECTCSRGKWKCKEISCTGSCSVEGGSHITSFDGFRYSFNGDCSYVLAKHDGANAFTILADLRRCGFASKKSCLRNVVLALQKGETVLAIRENGAIFLNWIQIQLPISVANITVFWSTSFYINIHTTFDVVVQVQFVPSMQVYVTLGPSYHGQTLGLCGNFNNIQSDDFKAISGVSEGTAAAFVNTWKSNSNCRNIKNSYEDPCSVNLEKEKYARHWCGLLTSPSGPFSPCHSIENPLTYHANCLSDTCSCKDSEECMCAALASYAYACAKKSVTLIGWRDKVCEKYTKSCKDSQVYQYNVTRCQPTCRSRSNADTFNYEFSPVDGCVCRGETYLNDNGDCVASSSCPCYYEGNAMQSGEMVEENGIACTCERGHLTCVGAVIKEPVCPDPLAYFNCSGAPKGTKGVECQKNCHTLDMDCFSSQCISGCMCPPGLVSDGEGGCISKEQCPCVHNEATYKPGDTILIGCNTCICKNRRWQCTHKPCLTTCSVYGDGHYMTFDSKQFTFSGSCEYILAQDNCGDSGGQSSFKVITENVPCGTTGTTCSKNIKFFIGGEELRLDNEKIEVMKRDEKNTIPYHVMQRGMYLVIKTDNDVILLWDKKTTLHIKLEQQFQGKVCGICGNYDGNANNDFTTRSQSVVENLLEFGNSWKTDNNCPNVHVVNDPCSINPYRKSWALRQCGIITSEVFKSCHTQVDPTRYYESCISDSCACDTGGDCECFCTTVALYAQACSENGLCINWRTPTICPVFCDYYNDAGECEWHYKACGDKCMKTCRNPEGDCLHELSGCEGCYPKCPPSRPYFDEDNMKCVAQCGCVDNGNFYKSGDKIQHNCSSCVCAKGKIRCDYDITACQCFYEGNIYYYEDTIPYPNVEDGKCNQKKCGENGSIVTIAFNNCGTTSELEVKSNLTTTMMTTSTGIISTEQFTSRTNDNLSTSTHSTTTSTKSTMLYTSATTPMKSSSRSPSPSTTESIKPSTATVLKTTSGPSTHSTTTSTKSTLLNTTPPHIKSTSHSPSPSTTESIIPSTTTVLKTTSGPSTHSTTTSTKSTLLYTPPTPIKSTSHSTSPLTTESIIPSTTTVLKTTSGPSTHSKTTSTKSTLLYTPPTIPIKSTSHSPISSTTELITPSTTTVLKPTTGPSTPPIAPITSTSHSPSPLITESIIQSKTTVLKTTLGPSTHSTTTSSKFTRLYTPPTTPIQSISHSPGPSTTESILPSTTTVLTTTSGPSTHSTTTSTKSTLLNTPPPPIKSTSHSPSPSTTESIIPSTTTVLKTTSGPSTHSTTTSTKSTLLYTPPPPIKSTSHSPSPLTTESIIPSTTTVLKTTSGPSTHSTTTSTKSTLLYTPPIASIKSTSHSPSPSITESIIASTTTVLKTTSGPSTHSTTTSTKSTLLNTPPPTTMKSTSRSPSSSTTESIIPSTTVLKTTSGPSTHSTTTSTKSTLLNTTPPPIKSTSHSPSPSTTESIIPSITTVLTTTSGPSTHSTTTSTKSTLLYTPPTPIKSTSHSTSPLTTESIIPSTTTVLKTTSGQFTHSTTTSTKSTLLYTPPTIPIKSTSHSPSLSTTELITPSTTTVLKPTTSPSTNFTTIFSKPTMSYTSRTTLSTSPTVYCHWTDWFDMNHPTSDNDGGDEENYEIAKYRGVYVCSNKTLIKDIKCRASSYPDISIKNLPQKVTCNIEKGLLCRNQDNPGPFNMCLNYQVKFCCEDILSTTLTSAAPRSTSTLTFSISTTESTTSTASTAPLSSPKSSTSFSERPHFCVYEGSTYKVGSSVPKNPESCEECKCTKENNIAKVTCKIKVCQTKCSLGFTYKPEPTKCCGKCVQNTCVLEATEIIKGHSIGNLLEQCCHNCSQDVCAINNTVLIKPGKVWNPSGDKCTFYDCDANKMTVIRREMSCPVQKYLTCPEGIMVNFTSADGCCTIHYCEPRKCDVMKSWKVIESEGCTANVTLTNCGGYCSSVSRHPSFPKMVKHDCTCCQPKKTTSKKVQLLCKTGRKISYSYTDVLECACRGAACVFTE